MNGTAPQWLAGPSSLGGANGATEGGASPERSGATQGDLTSSDYSVISGRPSDVNGSSTNGVVFTDSMAAGLTPAAAVEFIYNLLQQNKQLKDSLNVSNSRMSELVALLKKQKLELQSKDDELKQRNLQCKQRIEELTAESQRAVAAMSELKKLSVQDKSLPHAHDSLYKTGVAPVAETCQVEASGNGYDRVSFLAPVAAGEDYPRDYAVASETGAYEGIVEDNGILDRLRNEVMTKTITISDLKSKCASKDDEINRLKIEIGVLGEELFTLREHDDQLTTELAQDHKKLEASADVLRKRDAEIRDLKHLIVDLQQKVEEFRGQNQTQQGQIKTLVSRITSLQEEITVLQQRRGEPTQVEELRGQNSKLQAQVTGLLEEIKLLQQRRGEEAQLELNFQQVGDLRKQLKSSEEKRNSILQQCAELSDENEKLKKEREVDSQRHDQFTLKLNTVEQALSAERRENGRVRQLLSEKTMKFDDLKRTYEDVIKELNEVKKKQNCGELREQIDEYRMLLQQAEQLAKRRGDEVADLRQQLQAHEDDIASIVVLKHQLEVYRMDFDAERKAREEKHAEAEQLRGQLDQLQLRYQQLVDELEAYSIRHLDDMRRRHAQPASSVAAAGGVGPGGGGGGGYDPFIRASPAGVVPGGGVGGGMGLGAAGAAAAQPGRVGGGAQPWSSHVRPQPTMHAEAEQGDYARDVQQQQPPLQRMPPYRLGGSASDPQMELGADARLGYAPVQHEPQRLPATFQPSFRQPQLQQASMQQPHVPLLQPARVESLRCPICNMEVPDFDSLNVHVNECIDMNGAA